MPRNVYTEDHEAFRSSVREFIDRHMRPRAEEMIRDKTIPREIWKAAGDMGLFGLDIPEEFGGAGAEDYRFNAIAAEEYAKFTAATATCFGIHADVCPPYLVDLGTQEQKEKWLPGIASGELICAIAMTEPSGGSDLAALKTTAVKDGDHYIVNGSKTFITNGYQCDLAIVAVRTDPSKGAKGISLLMFEDGMEGFSKGQKLDKVGQEESDTSELFFDNVRVPADRLLGPEGMGFISMMQKLPQERLGNAVGCVAHAAQILGQRRFHKGGEIEAGGSRRLRQMIALVPALHRAVPQHAADRGGEGQRPSLKLGGGAEPGQAVDVGLVFGDVERRHVLDDRVRTRKAERYVLMFGDAAGIEHDIAGELRIGLLEEAGHAHRERIDWPQSNRDIEVGDHVQRLRQREVAVGTAEREEQVDPQGHALAPGLAQHRRHDQAVERHDHCEIGATEPVVGQHQRGGGDVARGAGAGDVGRDPAVRSLAGGTVPFADHRFVAGRDPSPGPSEDGRQRLALRLRPRRNRSSGL